VRAVVGLLFAILFVCVLTGSQTIMGAALIWSLVTTLLLSVALFIYAALFMIIHKSKPRDPVKQRNHSKWVSTVCAPEGIINTVYSWGYVRASFTRCWNYYKVRIWPVPFALEGQKAPDAKLVDLHGNPKSLLHDYIQAMPAGKPIILNMGSYS
jgi:hypothetical protein